MMIRATSIALTFALYGYADADADAGESSSPLCHPAFAGSSTYGPGAYVSAPSTVETTTPCTCGDSACPTPAGQTSGCSTTTTTTETHNYQCVSGANSAYCNQDAFKPGSSEHWSLAWTKESAQCSGNVTPTPPPTPAVWAGSGCPGAYVAGTDYAAADKVSVAGTAYTAVYECAAAPNNLFCGKPLYEPGTGEYWETVWTALGSCSGSISPTSSPSFLTITDAGGCPDAWEAGVKYDGEDSVSKNGLVFQCKEAPFNGFCGQAGYEPMKVDDPSEHWKTAWTVVGHCSGTISPTSTPSFDPANHVGGCPDAWVAGVKYDGEDNVSKNGLVFQCKEAPFNGLVFQCKEAPMKVDDPSEHWKTAWTVVGHCSG